MDHQYYIEKWLNGTLSDEEKVIFEQTDSYKSLEKLSKAVRSFKAPEFDVQSEFHRLHSKKVQQESGKMGTITWLRPLLRVAAVIVFMVGGYFLFLSNSATTINTLASEKFEVLLPDSSAVTLNAFSTLSYYEKGWNKKRQVTLVGEAYFKVAKGSRFDVETASGTVTVLGTQFTVKMRKNYFEVICYEGLVQVQSTGQVVNLSPNKVFRVVNGAIFQNENTTSASPSWLAKESSFESVPVFEMLGEFERQYNVTIITKNVSLDQLFTGRFGHTDISLALKSISIPLDLKYEISDDQKTVVLSGEVK